MNNSAWGVIPGYAPLEYRKRLRLAQFVALIGRLRWWAAHETMSTLYPWTRHFVELLVPVVDLNIVIENVEASLAHRTRTFV